MIKKINKDIANLVAKINWYENLKRQYTYDEIRQYLKDINYHDEWLEQRIDFEEKRDKGEE